MRRGGRAGSGEVTVTFRVLCLSVFVVVVVFVVVGVVVHRVTFSGKSRSRHFYIKLLTEVGIYLYSEERVAPSLSSTQVFSCRRADGAGVVLGRREAWLAGPGVVCRRESVNTSRSSLTWEMTSPGGERCLPQGHPRGLSLTTQPLLHDVPENGSFFRAGIHIFMASGPRWETATLVKRR
ncbi:hypothetical protein E2C01_010586 [Portunus trituberculatus]|uniref:Uncharacterized protein n=1 Tax=Portunus trituberculatus TaxID=210409 RepID=A0A5B7D924_PORTR|nr:hypothetical protein [Portunus trituberculatus]